MGEDRVEKEIVFDAASTKSEKRYDKDQKIHDKIIFPYKIDDRCVTHYEEDGMSLKEAKKILESDEFFAYIKNCGTPTTTSSYRVSVRDIEDYHF